MEPGSEGSPPEDSKPSISESFGLLAKADHRVAEDEKLQVAHSFRVSEKEQAGRDQSGRHCMNILCSRLLWYSLVRGEWETE